MIRLPGMRWSVYEVTAKLANILKQGAIPFRDIIPEAAGGKFRPDHDRSAIDENRANSHYAADTVIQREAIQHTIGGTSIHQAGKPVTPLHEPKMADVGGFGHACRARERRNRRSLWFAPRLFESPQREHVY